MSAVAGGPTPGPWRTVLHGNERYPYPLTIETESGMFWIARGTVSNLDDARVLGAAWDMLEALENLENDDGAIPDHAWQMAQDAIRKARGLE